MERQRTGLLQQEAAACLGVMAWTLSRWEAGKAVPPVRFMPAIIAFLGYCPWAPVESLGARLMAARRAHGLSRKRLAALFGVVEPTVQSWEENRTRPGAGFLKRIDAVLGCAGSG